MAHPVRGALIPRPVEGPVKPRLRGYLHQWAFVVSLVTGAALIAFADPGEPRVAASVYSFSVTLLFGTSALYHRLTWGPRGRSLMQRLDHSTIFILIAGTYTPIALLVLPRPGGPVLLAAVWSVALVGVGVRMLWQRAPRWSTVALCLALGWSAVLIFPGLWNSNGGVTSAVLVGTAGLLYTAGAAIFATRWPNPSPLVFGYHEVFHLLTIVAGALLYIASSFAIYGA